MFTCKIVYDSPVREIALPVTIGCTECFRKIRSCKGIIDTGATSSMIARNIVSELELVPVGASNISGVHGIQAAQTYLADIYFGSHLFQDLHVAEASSDAGFDFLIGMDILDKTEFHFARDDDGFRMFQLMIPDSGYL